MEIVEDSEKGETEEFRIVDGRATKRVTRTEFESILQEYDLNKKESQKEITLNEDGTYSLPLNYPIGIADIEQYVDFS